MQIIFTIYMPGLGSMSLLPSKNRSELSNYDSPLLFCMLNETGTDEDRSVSFEFGGSVAS